MSITYHHLPSPTIAYHHLLQESFAPFHWWDQPLGTLRSGSLILRAFGQCHAQQNNQKMDLHEKSHVSIGHFIGLTSMGYLPMDLHLICISCASHVLRDLFRPASWGNHQAELKSRTLPDWEAGLRADINRLREAWALPSPCWPKTAWGCYGLQCGAPKIGKLVTRTPISMGYGRYI